MPETLRIRRPEAGLAALWRALLVVLPVAALVLLAAALARGIEHDEVYSIFVTGQTPRPDWPTDIVTAGSLREPFLSHADGAAIAEALRRTDVHPPLYFWALGLWRPWAGDGLLALRGLSIAFSLSALLVWMVVAWRAGAPPLLAGLLICLAYGFGYTGHIARGFALAHLCLALAALAALLAWGAATPAPRALPRQQMLPRALPLAGLAGVMAGLACLSNFLAVFPAGAVLAWLALAVRGWGRRIRLALGAGLPFLLLLAIGVDFFLAQKSSRTGQFEAFQWLPAIRQLGQFNSANLLGGLPLYAGGMARQALEAALAALLAAVALLVVSRWRRLGPTAWLWLAGAAAPSLGLLALGYAFNNLPVELRYLAFATPFVALLLAAAAAVGRRQAPRLTAALFGLLIGVQAAGTLGMVLHPMTQQPFHQAMLAVLPRLGPGSVLLLPFADDGVGVTGALLHETPADQAVLVLRNEDAGQAPARLQGHGRAVLLSFGVHDGPRQAAIAAGALREDPGWRSLGRFWSDYRGPFAELFERVAAP